MISLTQVHKHFGNGAGSVEILKGVTLSVSRGEIVGLLGRSGAGKTTLLNLIAGIDDPTSGSIAVAGQNLAALNRGARARLRREHIGFVFQHFHLLPGLTAIENVEVPLALQGMAQRKARGLAAEYLARVGLQGCEDRHPAQLSGGERQRVAIARAIAPAPSLLLADEPTGALDAETGAQILDLLLEVNGSLGAAMVIVTHEQSIASRCHRVLYLRDGVLGRAQ